MHCDYIKGREEETLDITTLWDIPIRVHKKIYMAEDYEGPREVDDILAYLSKNFNNENENENENEKKL